MVRSGRRRHPARADRALGRRGERRYHDGLRAGERYASMVVIKRAYEPRSRDGLRVLVDRLWPRGLGRRAAAIDWWARELAPSHALRRWFGHDPRRWTEFQLRYRRELPPPREALARPPPP